MAASIELMAAIYPTGGANIGRETPAGCRSACIVVIAKLICMFERVGESGPGTRKRRLVRSDLQGETRTAGSVI